MSIQTKKRFKNIGKIVGGLIFALILFTNIKIALLDDNEVASGDISVLGIELNLFEATYANEGGASCSDLCLYSPDRNCTMLVTELGTILCKGWYLY
jgi:hypothetical protein